MSVKSSGSGDRGFAGQHGSTFGKNYGGDSQNPYNPLSSYNSIGAPENRAAKRRNHPQNFDHLESYEAPSVGGGTISNPALPIGSDSSPLFFPGVDKSGIVTAHQSSLAEPNDF